MRAPDFWARDGLAAQLLAPFGGITRRLTARRVARRGFDAGIPVFCAGNASVGGAGKTILARDILARLPGKPFALTRGYGGKMSGPVLVDLTCHGPAEVGDEALLLATTAPTIVAHDRAAGARLARELGATAIVMDDGLQNPSLVKTASFLVVDGGYGFGNGRLLPAGPLREPLAAAAARCMAAVMIGADEVGARRQLPEYLPVLQAQIIPACPDLPSGTRVFAFAGIGRPEKFFASAMQLGMEMTGAMKFPDHHVYTAADEAKLHAAAQGQQAQLLTTEKDFVKLPPGLKAQTKWLSVHLAWDDEPAFETLLRGVTARLSES
ncbi:MAG: tetraacyldisaccharide 4'-kinase [Acidocella sp.]|nr:tetraacyldisaccharide 4'-kinase [Acidocella sp.]MDE8349519.1 tetraacyldisaccharide 4'-kinase [Acidocella sp.]